MGRSWRGNPDDSLLLAQTFVGVAGVTMLLAAVTTQRRLADDALGHIAHTLQSSLLPSALPAIPGVEAPRASAPPQRARRSAATSTTCSRTTAGAGRSSSATSAARDRRRPPSPPRALHAARVAVQERSPSEILTLLNEALLKQGSEFCTAAYARLDRDETGARLTVSVGRPPAAAAPARRRDGRVGRPAGLLLGLEARPQPQRPHARAQPGDALMLYTDGLTDAYARTAPSRPTTWPACSPRAPVDPRPRSSTACSRPRSTTTTKQPRDDIALVVVRLRHRWLPAG